MGQAWFRERYGNVYTLIVNNFAEPSETPEHNALQARFLDEQLCRNLLIAIGWAPLANPLEYERQTIRDRGWSVDKIHYDFDDLQDQVARGRKLETQCWPNQPYYPRDPFGCYSKESKSATLRQLEETLDKASAEIEQASGDNLRITLRPQFEVAGWDVVIYAEVAEDWRGRQLTLVELKPSLGGDYPAILRQMKANSRIAPYYGEGDPYKILVFDQFAAAGATLDQVRAIFAASGFTVLSIGEISQAKP